MPIRPINEHRSTRHEKLARILAWASLLALMVWAVSLILTGYVFAPMIFSKWPKLEAGLITGELLRTTYVIGLVCALIVLVDMRVRFAGQLQKQKSLWAAVFATALVVIQYAVITPKMQALKATMQVNPADAQAFMYMHGISQILYLIHSAVVLFLLLHCLKHWKK